MVKNLCANAGDAGDVNSIPGSGRSPGGGQGNPLQYSCLKNPMDRGARPATVHGVAEADTTKHTCMLVNEDQLEFSWGEFIIFKLFDRNMNTI